MYAVLGYGFPLLMLLFEWGFRMVLAIDASGFIGPTLAGAGLSLLIPLTQPKERSVQDASGKKGYFVSVWDLRLIPIVHILIFLFLFNWVGTCYASLKYADYAMHAGPLEIPLHWLLGGAAYAVSLLCILIKEKIA